MVDIKKINKELNEIERIINKIQLKQQLFLKYNIEFTIKIKSLC